VKNKSSIADWLQQARTELHPRIPQEPASSLYALLEKSYNQPRAWLLAHPDAILTEQQLLMLEKDLQALLQGKPLAYILQYWDFYGMRFHVSPDVLIPRPESELLVETALEILSLQNSPSLIADVGTGSGCIAAAIAAHRSDASIIASDISFNALRVASQNFRHHTLQERVFLLQCNLLSGVEAPFDLICANLPYIPSHAVTSLEVSRFEPSLALDGGEDGMHIMRALLDQSHTRLTPYASILLEMQFDQANAVSEMARLHFPGAQMIIKKDLANRDRLLVIQL